uniref:Site-specific integrase n=1 Tax=Roseihalotalea indica TaxID=2867963 RepID=A0AA49GHS8_9BACT|nr:site-specific integrase [Tunicatimonas sp. TK19036]
MSNVTTAIILDTRRPIKDGNYPIKLRVTYQRKQKYYPLDESLSEEDFLKIQGSKPRGKYKDYQLEFNGKENHANEIIKSMPSFTFEEFEKQFLNKKVSSKDVFSLYERYIQNLSKEGRAGTASSYQCSLSSIRTFVRKKKLAFAKVNPDFLHDYERWMISKGSSNTTIGIYLRSLRTILNLAIEEGLFSQEDYPFGKRKYQIPAGRNVKKALTLEDIQKIFDYDPQTDAEARARDLWLFSYLCNGINMKDIARLKYQNVDNEKITFIRAKTERTSKKNLKPVVAILTLEAKGIIERWGNKPTNPNTYVFDILINGLTPEKELARVKQATKTINKYIKRIAKAIGIEKEVSTYTARHSFSTVLKRSGVPIEFISESLGHHDIRTTEHYLDSFEHDVKKQYASALTNFQKNPSQ